MSDEPEMRAAQTQTLLESVKKLPAQHRGDILRAIGSQSVEKVRSVLPISFLPMKLHMHISDCVRDVIGPERNVAFWRDTMVASFNRPFLKPFVALTIGIFGVSPSGLLRRCDRVYEHITRNSGSLAFVPEGDRGGRVVLKDFPAEQFRFICYVEGLAGCLEAALEVCKSIGTVRVLEQDARGDVTYGIAWS